MAKKKLDFSNMELRELLDCERGISIVCARYELINKNYMNENIGTTEDSIKYTKLNTIRNEIIQNIENYFI